MPRYIISYDLSKPERDYEKLHEYLESIKHTWHIQQSTWIIVTHLMLRELKSALLVRVDKDDSLFVGVISDEDWFGIRLMTHPEISL